jgi:hypothetical protein
VIEFHDTSVLAREIRHARLEVVVEHYPRTFRGEHQVVWSLLTLSMLIFNAHHCR